MIEPSQKHRDKKSVWRCLSLFFLSIGLLLSQSCAAIKPQPKEDFQITLLEKQINEMDKKLDEIYHRVSIIQFMIDNHERKLKDIEKSREIHTSPLEEPADQEEPVADMNPPEIIQEQPLLTQSLEPTPQPPPVIPEKTEPPKTLYNRALTAYKNAEYDKAISIFVAFSDKFPDHELADNSLYWAGECYYAKKDYSAAIISFKKVVTRYPEGSKIPDAFLKTGYAYIAMDDRENARLFLKKVIKNFPFSPAGSKAEEMLKRINK